MPVKRCGMRWQCCIQRAASPASAAKVHNPGSPKAPAISKAIPSAGAKRFLLPACSPDLNPIEPVHAWPKHLLRKPAERRKETLWRRIGALLDQFSPKEYANYLRNSGDGSIQTHPALKHDDVC